ncbi:hypothetical protein [Priestia endophytica]|uniref:hypothetical protein n=1 Tax=Priestia endophytica TaxID=135735 RepID=UPI00124EC862|nr:hypothetical protein [Priestia endophytica]KAB2492622.1 hypothetical protein F8155_15490 [Priestia endophytica]
MRKIKLIVFIGIIGLLVIGGAWMYSAHKENQVANMIEKQLEDRMNREFHVTNVEEISNGGGEYYYITVEMGGVKKPFKKEMFKSAADNLPRYAIIDELWTRQYEKEVQKIVKEHPLNIKRIESNVGIVHDQDPNVDIQNLPTIEEIRKQYGKKVIYDQITLYTNYPYPTDPELQEKEDEKIFNILKDMKDRDMDNNLSLSIQYTKYTQRYEILINDYQKDKYHSPEDMKKARLKTQEEVIESNEEVQS